MGGFQPHQNALVLHAGWVSQERHITLVPSSRYSWDSCCPPAGLGEAAAAGDEKAAQKERGNKSNSSSSCAGEKGKTNEALDPCSERHNGNVLS